MTRKGFTKSPEVKTSFPNGFTIGFSETSWEVVQDDIMEFFHKFHSNGRFQKSFKANFKALIGKTLGAVDVKDYQPISLVDGIKKFYPRSWNIG